MYFTISALLIFSLLLGLLVEYSNSIKVRKQASNNKINARLQSIIARGQHLLNGCSSLPLTPLSSIICLERILKALNALIKTNCTQSRLDLKAELESKLNQFRKLAAMRDNFYALLTIPDAEKELLMMAKHCMTLVMTLKVEQSKNYLSVTDVQKELEQLDILATRLKSSILNIQAIRALDCKLYDKSYALNEKAIALLEQIKSTDNAIINVINTTIDKFKLINDGISGVIEVNSHDFYEKYRNDVQHEEKNIHERSDGLEKLTL